MVCGGGRPPPQRMRFDPEPVGAEAVVLDDSGQAVGVALTDGLELPLAVPAVELAEHESRLRGGVLAQVVADDLGVVHGIVGVEDSDVGVGDLAEVLSPAVRLVDAREEDDLVGVRRQGVQLHIQALVIAVALTGPVVPLVLHSTGRVLEVVVEDEVLLGKSLAAGVGDQGRGVQVESCAVGGAGVPAEADSCKGHARSLLGQGDVAALGE